MTQGPNVVDTHAGYTDWDAAYVLGALSSAERQEFERHLHSCRRCTEAVSELAGMPGLLGRVDPVDIGDLLLDSASAAADDEVAGSAADLEPPVDLLARIERADRAEADRLRSRKFRRRAVLLVAAAVIAAAAIVLPIALTGSERPTIAAELTQTTPNPLTADVQLFGESWGTRITMTCGYAADGGWAVKQPTGAWTYALYLVDHEGKVSRVSSWTATRGSTVHATGSTNIDVSDIDTVQVRSVDTGAVLLTAAVG